MPAFAPPSSAQPVATAATVVLVDDDVALLHALRFSLEIEGYCVVTCATGEELVELLLPERGCLVVDYRLVGQDGLCALEALRRRGVTLPAVLITSYASPAMHDRARGVQATVVEKPLLGDVLVSCIRQALPLA